MICVYEIKHKKRKNDKRCKDELSSYNPGSGFFCHQSGSGTSDHPVSEETQDGTDRTS